MEKQSIVLSAQGSGSFDFNDKTFYKFEIEMKNGDVGEYNSLSQKQDRFIIGVETPYIFDTNNPKWPKIKPVYNFNSSPSRDGNIKNVQKAAGNNTTHTAAPEHDARQIMIIKQSSLKIAVEFCIHKKKDKATLSDLFKTADEIVKYVLKPTEPEAAKEWHKVPEKETTALK
tara:strand:+ start:1680 stop:2195 length:516 start_codon:yes stop_codon:yes gene_type:complete